MGVTLGARVVPRPLLVAGMLASVLPDFDVLAVRVGIDYPHELGHRGASHSIAFALAMAALACLWARRLGSRPWVVFCFVFVAGVSHPLLDMCTTGGMGISLWWPVSDDRLFFPAQVIEASPLSVRRFFTSAAIPVLASEPLWVWLPASALALAGRCVRRRRALGCQAVMGRHR